MSSASLQHDPALERRSTTWSRDHVSNAPTTLFMVEIARCPNSNDPVEERQTVRISFSLLGVGQLLHLAQALRPVRLGVPAGPDR